MVKPNFFPNLPKIYMTLEEAERLPEYSASMPSGQTIGKRWRRHDGAFDRRFIEAGGVPTWIICEYAESDEPGMININYYRLCIRKKALAA